MAQGFSQVHGEDYGEIYAPVAGMQTLRVFWATCAHFGLTIRQVDVSTAFFPFSAGGEGVYEAIQGLRPGLASDITELFKAVCGLKQGSRAWKKLLTSKLEAGGWVKSDADLSLYLQHDDDGDD